MIQPTDSPDRRVILDLYHGGADAETIRTAAEIARVLGLDLHGLFIEDEALLALAELPFAREFRLPAHQWSPLDTATIGAELRQAAARTRQLLDEIVQSVGVPGGFEVLRGDPATCMTDLCRTGDIIVIREPGTPILQTTRNAARLHAAAQESAASVLLLPPFGKPRPGPIAVLVTHPADPCLDVACRLARASGERLVILLPEAAGAADWIKAHTGEQGLPADRVIIRRIPGGEPGEILRALAGMREHLIVMTRTASPATAAAGIATTRGVPVLLIGPQPVKDQPAAGAR